MTYKTELKPEKSFLRVSLSGSETLEDNKDVTDRVLKECITNKHERILLDVRDLTAHSSNLPDIELAEYIFENGSRGLIHRIAVIYGSDRKDTALFFERFFQNRGLNLQAYEEDEDAIRWLQEGKEEKPTHSTLKPSKSDMTTIDVARVMDVSPDEVTVLARKGILQGKKVGKRWKFRRKDVLLLSKRMLEKE